MEKENQKKSKSENFNPPKSEQPANEFCIKKGCHKYVFAVHLCAEHYREIVLKKHKKEKEPLKSSRSEYGIWSGIKQRCLNENSPNFKHYGGRGINICDRWKDSFDKFISDVGPRPTMNHSIDRVDVNGNYEPGNVRWATRLEQSNNKRESKGGVCWSETDKCFVASIVFNRKTYNLGKFADKKSALKYRRECYDLAVLGKPNLMKRVKKPYSFMKEFRIWQTLIRKFWDVNEQKVLFDYKGCSIDPDWCEFDLNSDEINLKGFENFINNMGKLKTNTNKIGLIDPEKGYNKQNCVWT